MSIDIDILLNSKNMPSQKDWQLALRESGFDLVFQSSFDVSSYEGYLPCKYQGNDTGFEYTMEPFDTQELKEAGWPIDSKWNSLVTLTTHYSETDFLAGLMAASVLAQKTQGGFAVDGEPPLLKGQEGIRWVADQIACYQNISIQNESASTPEEDEMKALLARIRGQKLASFTLTMGRLCLIFEQGQYILLAAWRIQGRTTHLEFARMLEIRQKLASLHQTMDLHLPSLEETRSLERMEADLESAQDADFSDAIAAKTYLNQAIGAQIKTIELVSTENMVMELEGDDIHVFITGIMGPDAPISLLEGTSSYILSP